MQIEHRADCQFALLPKFFPIVFQNIAQYFCRALFGENIAIGFDVQHGLARLHFFIFERDGIDTVFTVDRKDFAVYRLSGRRRIKILP